MSEALDEVETEKVSQYLGDVIYNRADTEESWCPADVLQVPKEKRKYQSNATT